MPSMYMWDGTEWVLIASGGVNLTEQSIPSLPTTGVVRMYAQDVSGRVTALDSKGGEAMVDYARHYGYELEQWRGALGARRKRPANVLWLGDSLTEGAGAETFSSTLVETARQGIQGEVRDGGTGFIAAGRTSGFSWDWNARGVLAGAANDLDGGVGLGRHVVQMSAAVTDTVTFTEYGDRFYVFYYGNASTGTMRVVIDGVTSTQSTTLSIPRSGNIWDSGQLALGTHTITIGPNAASNVVWLEGIAAFATDETVGIHMWNGGHGGYTAWRFANGTGEDAGFGYGGSQRAWAQYCFQPLTVFDSGGVNVSSNGANPSTLTFSGTSPSFTAQDIGEVIYGDASTNAIPQGLRIVSTPSATTCVVNKQVTGGPYRMAFTRAAYTNASVTSGSFVLTHASAGFKPWDEGKTISAATLIPAGTIIKRVVNTTTVHLSKAATGSSSTLSIQIKNRQKYPVRPHLVAMMFGGNEMMTFGTSKASYKTLIQSAYNTLVDTGQLDVPTMTGIYTDERPSVLIQSYWAPAVNFTTATNTFKADTVSGSSIITYTATAQTLGVEYMPRFTTADIGRTISGTGLTGSQTISAMYGTADESGYYSACSISPGTASSTQSNTTLTFATRTFQDEQWRDFRRGNVELADANGWGHVDYYNLVGYVDTDPFALMHYDTVHPNGNGYQFMADAFINAMGGIKNLGLIPKGLFDNAGEIPVAKAADTPGKSPGIKRKVSADTASGTTAGVMVDITEWAFTIGPNETLSFLINLFWTAAATTSGILFDFNPAAGVSAPADIIMAGWSVNGTTGATTSGQWYGRQDAAWGTDLTIPSSATTGTTIPSCLQLSGQVTAGAVGGLITPRFGPEANAATTLQRGSWALIL